MAIVEVEAMKENPGTCFHCGGSGVEQDHIIEFQGIDINWGDTPYLCGECIEILCTIVGRVSEDEHKEVVAERDALSDQLTALGEQHEELKGRVKKMLDGARAKRDIKKEREAVTSG